MVKIRKENKELIKLVEIPFAKRTEEQTKRIYELIDFQKDKIRNIRISVICKGHTSSYYYPDYSCKTEDGGMKMLIKTLNKIEEPYKLKVEIQPPNEK